MTFMLLVEKRKMKRLLSISCYFIALFILHTLHSHLYIFLSRFFLSLSCTGLLFYSFFRQNADTLYTHRQTYTYTHKLNPLNALCHFQNYYFITFIFIAMNFKFPSMHKRKAEVNVKITEKQKHFHQKDCIF